MVSTTLLNQKPISLRIEFDEENTQDSSETEEQPQDTEDSELQSTDEKRKLVIQEFYGTETLSEPFEYTVLMVSNDPDIAFSEMIGKSVTLSLTCHTEKNSSQVDEKDKNDSSDQTDNPTTRYFHGVIGQFTQLYTARKGDDNVSYYEAKIYPQFWMLKFTQDCRIFQNLSAVDIIKQVLKENGVLNIEDKTKHYGRTPREYCVQYNESSFDFISRLLEEEGIFYYFKHVRRKHTLVLGEAPSSHEECPGAKTAEFEMAVPGVHYFNKLITCKVLERVVPSSHALVDYNFTTASAEIFNATKGSGGGGKFLKYPGLFDHEDLPKQTKLETIASLRIQADELPKRSIEATSTIPFFAPGFKFYMNGHTRKDVNQVYVLHTVIHEANIAGGLGPRDSHYRNQFTAFPFSIPYRSPLKTPKPRIYSTQTARVTGPKNEEIWTDKYGRIKVRFHWDIKSQGTGVTNDTENEKDRNDSDSSSSQASNDQDTQKKDDSEDEQNSSCWVRVAEGWAGNNWGILFTPRVGMEVVVTFLEGNPDRPLVIGSVYNSNNMPPYLPEQPTKSTIKSRSTKEGGEGFNELRFEDLKDSEEVFFHSQKDLTIRVNETVNDWIKKGSYWWWIDRGNREVVLAGEDDAVGKTTPKGQSLPTGIGDDNLTLLKGSRTMKLKGDKDANYNIIINHGDRFLEIKEGSNLEILKKGDYFIKQAEGNADHFIEKGDSTLTLDKGNRHTHLSEGNMTTHITKGDHSLVLKEGNDYKELTSGDSTFLVKDGLFYEKVKNNYTTIVEEGNQEINVQQGTQSITVQGNQTITLQSDQEITVEGNKTETISGDYTLNVTGNLEITVGGTLTIKSTGASTYHADAGITIDSEAEITVNAGAALTMDAEGETTMSAAAITINSEGAMTLESEGETTINATELNVTAETELAIEGLVSVTINGATITIEAEAEATMGAAGATTITGAMITIA